MFLISTFGNLLELLPSNSTIYFIVSILSFSFLIDFSTTYLYYDVIIVSSSAGVISSLSYTI